MRAFRSWTPDWNMQITQHDLSSIMNFQRFKFPTPVENFEDRWTTLISPKVIRDLKSEHLIETWSTSCRSQNMITHQSGTFRNSNSNTCRAFLQIDERRSSMRKSPKFWNLNSWLKFADYKTWSVINQETFRTSNSNTCLDFCRWMNIAQQSESHRSSETWTPDWSADHKTWPVINEELSKIQNSNTCREVCRSVNDAHQSESHRSSYIWTPDWNLQITKHDLSSIRNFQRFKFPTPVENFADRWTTLVSPKVTEVLTSEHLIETWSTSCRSQNMITHHSGTFRNSNNNTCRAFCKLMKVAHQSESHRSSETWTADWSLQITKHDQSSTRKLSELQIPTPV